MLEYSCSYGKDHCQYNDAYTAEADEHCDEACEYLTVTEATKPRGASPDAAPGYVAYPGLSKKETEELDWLLTVRLATITIDGHAKIRRQVKKILRNILAT